MTSPPEPKNPARLARPPESALQRHDAFDSLQALPRQVRSTDVAEVVRRMILSGELRPNDQLPSERDLALRFGVSRATMREAIRNLGAHGLVNVQQGRGTFVSRLSADDLARPMSLVLAMDPPTLIEVIEFRRALEPPVAALAALRATPAQRDELAECLAEGRRSVRDDDRIIDHDSAFHHLISLASGNRFMLASSANLARVALEARRRTVHLPSNNRKTIAEHSRIASAVIAGDADEAFGATARHLDRVLAQIRRAFPDG